MCITVGNDFLYGGQKLNMLTYANSLRQMHMHGASVLEASSLTSVAFWKNAFFNKIHCSQVIWQKKRQCFQNQ